MAVIFSAFVLLAGVAMAQNSSKCHHYSTDGATSATYTQHRFYDFRSLGNAKTSSIGKEEKIIIIIINNLTHKIRYRLSTYLERVR